MCGGTGGAAARAERDEKKRQIQIRGATNAVNTAFAGRDDQLNDFVTALREQFGAEAGRQKKVADRSLKFSLARGGLTGGSADADLGAELGAEHQRGILKGERLSQAALSDLKGADEASRARLIALAQGGASISSSASNAARAMQSNIGSAKAAGSLEGLGDIFGNTIDVFKNQEEAAERRRGLRESEVFAAPFSRAS